jgi:hypothetical protein
MVSGSRHDELHSPLFFNLAPSWRKCGPAWTLRKLRCACRLVDRCSVAGYRPSLSPLQIPVRHDCSCNHQLLPLAPIYNWSPHPVICGLPQLLVCTAPHYCQLEATQSCDWHNTFVCGGSALQIVAAECLSLWKAPIFPQLLLENASVLFWLMYRASCTVYCPDQQMHTGNTNTMSVYPIQNNLTSLITLRWPCIIYINSLQNYTHKRAQTVYTATKLIINSWYSSQCVIDCILSSGENILIYRFIDFVILIIFVTLAQ